MKIKIILYGIIGIIFFGFYKKIKNINDIILVKEKQRILLNQWIRAKQDGASIEDYLLKNNWKNIAIYGMGDMGYTLLYELEDTQIKVKYGIDRNLKSTGIKGDLEILKPNEELPYVDVIIVASFTQFKEIKDYILKKNKLKIISLQDIIIEM